VKKKKKKKNKKKKKKKAHLPLLLPLVALAPVLRSRVV
jgi:hypothetical protein